MENFTLITCKSLHVTRHFHILYKKYQRSFTHMHIYVTNMMYCARIYVNIKKIKTHLSRI